MTIQRFNHVLGSYITRVLLTVLAVLCVGCINELEPEFKTENVFNPGFITLDLSNTAVEVKSRATTEQGDDGLNENLISSVVVCLYPSNNPGNTPVIVKEFTSIDASSSAKIKIPLSAENKELLFPSGATKCGAYILANMPDAMSKIATAMTFDQIRALVISADFAANTPQASFVMDGSTAEIALQNIGTANEGASGSVELKRFASKLTLAVKVEECVTVTEGPDKGVWFPDLNNMTVTIRNGVNKSTLSPALYTPIASDYYSTGGNDADRRERGLVDNNKLGGYDSEYPFMNEIPFYTFANRWTDDPVSDIDTYMTLMVPWRESASGKYRKCYYTVPVTRGHEIARNISYRAKVFINMLGSPTPDEPMPVVTASYSAVDWNDVSLNVKIDDIRYLVVDRNDYVINNEKEIRIPVYTSHHTEVTDVQFTYYRYYVTARGNEYPITITKEQHDKTVEMNKSNSDEDRKAIYKCTFHNADLTDPTAYISYRHAKKVWKPVNSSGTEIRLTNLNSEDFAKNNLLDLSHYVPTDEDIYYRVNVRVTIAHADKIGTAEENTYTQVVNITQYPGMYITTTPNVFRSTGTTGEEGNTFINGCSNRPSSDPWYASIGCGSALNSNPNQYVVNVTQLTPDYDYQIGDPRSATIDNLYGLTVGDTTIVVGGSKGKPITETIPLLFTENGTYAKTTWVKASAIEGGKRKLQYYYPTDNSLDKSRWIAPKLRIASSYGATTNDKTYDTSRLRCAGYQEMGYPAGRWRLPTLGEIEFIIKLSATGKIPVLFSYERIAYHYYSAQGPVRPYDLNPDNPNRANTLSIYDYFPTMQIAVRCVYDEWYWGNDKLTPDANGKYTFTWGDRPKHN